MSEDRKHGVIQEKIAMITHRLMIALMGLGLGAIVVPQIALGAGTQIEQAIAKTQQAIQSG
jgi:hypothetical protein